VHELRSELQTELAVVHRRLQLLEAAAGLQVRARDRGALHAKVLELRAED
jgi:hypothetical protein